jgi:hypothetical protein
MENSRILIHLDTDVTPSVMDRIIALDAGADQVLSYGGARVEQIANIVRAGVPTEMPEASLSNRSASTHTFETSAI